MIVEATYVLCTTAPHHLQEKEAHHREKVYFLFFLNYILE